MTPKQLNKNPIEPIINVKPYQMLDIDEGEFARDEGQSTTSKNCQKSQYLMYLLNLWRRKNQWIHLKLLKHPSFN